MRKKDDPAIAPDLALLPVGTRSGNSFQQRKQDHLHLSLLCSNQFPACLSFFKLYLSLCGETSLLFLVHPTLAVEEMKSTCRAVRG